MKRLLPLLLLSAAPIGASAQSYLTLRQTSGYEVSLPLEGLKITFPDGKLVATAGTQKATIALSDMASMYFATQPTAIRQAVTATDGVSATIEGGTLRVTAPEGTSVGIWSTDGRMMPTQGLPKGAYIVRVGDRVMKVMAR